MLALRPGSIYAVKRGCARLPGDTNNVARVRTPCITRTESAVGSEERKRRAAKTNRAGGGDPHRSETREGGLRKVRAAAPSHGPG